MKEYNKKVRVDAAAKLRTRADNHYEQKPEDGAFELQKATYISKALELHKVQHPEEEAKSKVITAMAQRLLEIDQLNGLMPMPKKKMVLADSDSDKEDEDKEYEAMLSSSTKGEAFTIHSDDEGDNNIKFMFLTRSSTANSQEFDPFPLYVKPLDEMKIIREKAINYCHSATDITMDKLALIKLKIKGAGGRVVPFTRSITTCW